MLKYHNLQRTYVLNAIIINLITILFLGSIWIYSKYQEYHNEINQIKDEYVDDQKTTIKNEVENAVTYIDNIYRDTEKELNNTLKLRSNEIVQIIFSFFNAEDYKKNSDREEIMKLLIKLNRSNRNNDIFIIHNGKLRDLNPGVRQGVTFPADRVNLKNLLKKSEKALFENNGIFSHSWETSSNEKHRLTACVKYFEPFDWIVGVAIDYDEFVSERQFDVILRLSHVRYGKNREGYLFANLENADLLLSNGIITKGQSNSFNLMDTNGLNTIQEQLKAAHEKGGDFIHYSSPRRIRNGEKADSTQKQASAKILYVKGFEPWNWMVGAGFYLDDLELMVARKKDDLHQVIRSQILTILLAISLSVLVTLLLVHLIKKRMAHNFNSFTNFFNNASSGKARIDLDKIFYQEFKNLAVYANRMVEQRELAEHGFRQIVEFSPFPICILKNNQTQYVNPQWLKLIGYSIPEIPSVSRLLIRCFPDTADRQLLQKANRRESVSEYETDKLFVISCKDGQLRHMKLNYIEMMDDRFMIAFEDYTFRKKIEDELNAARLKAEESDSLKSAFLANMSHEIRTPMNAIVGFAGLLQNETLAVEKRQKYLSLIQKSSESLLNLINDILDISKIEAGQLHFQIVKGNLEETFAIIGEEVQSIRDTMGKKDIRLIQSYRLQPGEGIVETDFLRLKQVWMNLLSNALKFTYTGYIEYGCELANRQTILFYVKDTGIGIKEAYLKDIFNRFIKIEEDRTQIFRGAGLGLAISRKIVEALGGSIWVESTIGAGSVFWFTIPRKTTPPTRTSRKNVLR